MKPVQITITGSSIKIEIIGKPSVITKQDIKSASKQAIKMLDEVLHGCD